MHESALDWVALIDVLYSAHHNKLWIQPILSRPITLTPTR